MGVVIESSDNIAPGTVAPFPHNNIPDGWLICNGAVLNKNMYLNLFNKIGTTYGGSGDFFNLPNYALKGVFLRNLGPNNNSLGPVQGDAIRNITGNLYHFKNDMWGGVADGCFSENGAWPGDGTSTSNMPTWNIIFNAASQVPTADENRPVNMAVVYCIKY